MVGASRIGVEITSAAAVAARIARHFFSQTCNGVVQKTSEMLCQRYSYDSGSYVVASSKSSLHN